MRRSRCQSVCRTLNRFVNTIPGTFTASETFDVGMDTCSPVANDYFDKAPFKFEGKLQRIFFKNL